MRYILPFVLLAGCSEIETVFVPSVVQAPVAIECKMPDIAEPPNLIAALPKDVGLTDGTKAFLAQHEYDAGYIVQLKAALQACR